MRRRKSRIALSFTPATAQFPVQCRPLLEQIIKTISMQQMQIGQRWLVDTDSALGLGLVVEVEGRRLTLEFPATGETRQYSRNNAPLTRAVFSVGDTIETSDGESHVISAVEEINDLLIYMNEAGDPIPETQLAATIQLHHPLKRLLAGQLDKPGWFDVRERLAGLYQRWLCSDTVGLQGARITLTPHQLYVAHSATALNPVRVLLADEVGLGKTIEAGLILQRLQLQNRAQRALVVVPEALCVQWFVELLRCFAIHAVLVNEETEAEDLTDSRVYIASHQFLENPLSTSSEHWDLIIVDEAHHFDLNDGSDVSESLLALADQTQHLLLLTATPERLGLESHFSRLQLLDKEKFYNFEHFQKDYQRYQSLAEDLSSLLKEEEQALSAEQRKLLANDFGIEVDESSTKGEVIELLLDSHGTGRMVYRNTRHAVAGFPKRQLVPHHLDDGDQREWLAAFIKEHKGEKLLLITHSKEDVLSLREWLYRKTGVDCPVFHEDMSLVERDRAAAYFADSEYGSPLLLCSEIGSEGRNFQFCHRLICWDLPEHPDVLEQRIGRLDRIGQTQDIEIHVCVRSAEMEKRLYWFHNVLHCIEKLNPAAGVTHDKWYNAYLADESIESAVKQELAEILQELESGRDRLLEMNSCRHPDAEQLVEKIATEEFENNPQEWLETIADLLNIHYEQLDDKRYRLVPSDQMLIPVIPGIPSEGTEITFDRDEATAREDLAFITWDHPLMQGLQELISSAPLGVASVALLPNKNLRPGMLFAEVLFDITVTTANQSEIQPYLPQSSLRVVVTQDNAKNLQAALPSEQLSWLVQPAEKSLRFALIKNYRELIENLVNQAQKLGQGELTGLLEKAQEQIQRRQNLEAERLSQLKQHNESITDDLIGEKQAHYQGLIKTLSEQSQLTIQAVRLLITSKPEN